MSSDSDDVSIISAAKTRRYRQRKRAGIVARPMASADEQHRLLSLPFETLTPKQKARVRYYRRRDRNQQQHEQSLQLPLEAHVQQQAQLVASRFTDISHMTTASPVLSPPMDMMSSQHQPFTGVHPMPPPSSIPPFIPVAMVPSSYFTTLFPHAIPSVTPILPPS